MRRIAIIGMSFALAGSGVAFAEEARPVETIRQWHFAGGLFQDGFVVWTRATGTAAAPDLCRDFALGTRREGFTPAEAAAIRRERAACLILTCTPDPGRPPRYEATLLLFGAAGAAYEKVPRGSPPLRAQVVLRLDDGPLPLSVGLIAPLPVQRVPKGSWSLVPFRAAPIERGALERILKSLKATAMPVNQFFAAYIWVIPFTSAAYSFDLAGGAEALARLDARCQ
jgi:hypothetical protein